MQLAYMFHLLLLIENHANQTMCGKGCAHRWFEVDQPDVVRAKKALLGKMGAAIEAADNAAARFPLTAASVHWLSADLQLAGWPQALAVSGLDATRPVLWHAEGLLNYLTPNAVQNLLAEASKVGHVSAHHTAFDWAA